MAVSGANALLRRGTGNAKLPLIDALSPLYSMGVYPRHGNLIMIAGRSGSGKSSFALFLAEQWGLDTLYFSADMSAAQASQKVAAMRTQATTDKIEAAILAGEGQHYVDAIVDSKVRFSFGTPIKQKTMMEEINAHVDLYNKYPSVIVIDNLLNMEGAESEYQEQMAAMQALSSLSRDTGATVVVLHHASDKSWDANSKTFYPPSRQQVKGGMSEAPELTLSVALDNRDGTFNVAPIKQRMGYQDPTGETYVSLGCNPAKNTYWASGTQSYEGAS